MIKEYPNYPTGTVLLPTGDSIPWRTWRENGPRHEACHMGHKWPTRGCHGTPLDGECPYQGQILNECFMRHCSECNGTGRIQLDHPNRTNMP